MVNFVEKKSELHYWKCITLTWNVKKLPDHFWNYCFVFSRETCRFANDLFCAFFKNRFEFILLVTGIPGIGTCKKSSHGHGNHVHVHVRVGVVEKILIVGVRVVLNKKRYICNILFSKFLINLWIRDIDINSFHNIKFS